MIQRVLHLARDRYVQMLTSPVGVLWPIWMTKQELFKQLTDRVGRIFALQDNQPLMTSLRSSPLDLGAGLQSEETLPDEVAGKLAYDLPGVMLFGGPHLPRQAKMVTLFHDLGAVLWTVERLFRQLTDDDEHSPLRGLFSSLRQAGPGKEKVAEEIANACLYIGRGKAVQPEAREILGSLVKELFTETGLAMSKSLFRHNKGMQDKVSDAFKTWGWAALFEYVRYTTTGFSPELMLGDK